MTRPAPRILEGIRILDLTRFLSGPQATLFLAALGAEVIRIDDPALGDPTMMAPPFFGPDGVSLQRRSADDLGIAYLKRARGKKAVTLNLKSEEGRALLFRLVAQADVLVENFRAGVTEKLGMSYEVLRQHNPRLIHCAITGYGSTGPERSRKAFDLMVQAATGLMSITGDADGAPCKTGSPLSDGIAGTFAMAGILAALLQRERTGEGQFVDVSMADCLVSLVFDEPLDCYEALGLPFRQGNRIMRFSPFNTYPARDGTVAIGAATREDWVALLQVMGCADLLASDDHMNPGWRIANNGAVDALVAQWTRGCTCTEILDALNARDVPCSPVRSVAEVAAWTQLGAREMLRPVRHPRLPEREGPLAPAFPLKFGAAVADHASPAPLHGQHNDEIFGRLLGLSAGEMDGLAQRGVI